MRGTFFSKRMTPAWVAALLTGLLAAASPWLDKLRPAPLGQQAVNQFLVTSGADAGTGSLREAIFVADRTDGRVRVVVDAPAIVLESPLPPIINATGVAIEAARAGVRIDASRLVAGPVLDVASPNTTISGLAITGAPGQAVLLRTGGARLTRMHVQRSAVGVFAIDGVDDLIVSDSTFEGNGVGIQLGADTQDVQLRNNRFRGHARAAVWSVAPTAPPASSPLAVEIAGNEFDGDETSIVLINTVARVERNTFIRARTAGVFVRGSAVTVRGNRVQSGLGFGINATELDHAVIAENEINHNCGGGILVREARGTQLSWNRLYSNGYGIVMVLGPSGSPNTVADNVVMRNAVDGLYVIGASPLIRRNRLLENEGIGLRVSSLRAKGHPIIESRPLVEANVLAGNKTNVPVADEFRASDRETPGILQDCAWRASPAAEPGTLPARSVQ